MTQIVFVKHPFVFLVPNATMETNLGFPYPESEMADAAAFQSFIMEIQQGKMPKIVLLYSLFLHIDAHNIRIHVRLLDTLKKCSLLQRKCENV